MFKKYFSILSLIFSIVILIFSCYSYESDTLLYFPIHSNYTISSEFGNRLLGSYHFHNGIDIPAPFGTPVYALSSGTVISTGFSNSYGNYIIISYLNGYKSLYGHMSEEKIISEGDCVSSSEIIGYVGPKYLSSGKLNGFTTGPHLHFTLYYNGTCINPLSINYN